MEGQIEEAIAATLADDSEFLLADWVEAQVGAPTFRPDLVSPGELRSQSVEFLEHLREAVAANASSDIHEPAWEPLRDFLVSLSRGRAQQGFSPAETATFVFSFKQPLFKRLSERLERDPTALVRATWTVTTLLDRLGLLTTESYLSSREALISRQQSELMELSTPVVKVWEGVVAVPLIGTLDSARTQVVMESLLQKIVETDASVAIIDITGVPMVDTLVAQHLIKTVAAARLMGADCIISGIRPQIAQTIVHLGIQLEEVATKATLADAITLALQLTGYKVSRRSRGPADG